MYDLGVPRRQRHELLLNAVKHMWRPVDPRVRLQRGSERARWTIERLKQAWEQSDRACSRTVRSPTPLGALYAEISSDHVVIGVIGTAFEGPANPLEHRDRERHERGA